MKFLIAFSCLLLASADLFGQNAIWQPRSGLRQIAIWPGAAPDPAPVRGPEAVATTGTKELVAGRPWTYVSNVTLPTMTVEPAKGRNSGAAVVVFPGGGYQILAIDLEGTEVCDWLTSRGITCVLLKYRVTDVGPYPKSGPYPESPMALEDAQRTLGLVRFHAAEWGIDPHRIGVLGFSAGGSLVAEISTHDDKRLYAAVDAADRLSCRPDFAAAIYPGHISISFAEEDAAAGAGKYPLRVPPHVDEELGLNPDLHFTRATPPTFLVQAEDDNVDGVDQALAYFLALKKAGAPAEMHLYARGGHAFGLRPTKLPITRWPELMERWMATIGMIPSS